MSLPRPARVWIATVAGLAVAAMSFVWFTQPSAGIDPLLALAVTTGVVLTSLLPIRYRLGGQTHALTADEAVLLAMLLSLPAAWAPLLAAGGVAFANAVRRTPTRIPAVRILFNFSLVGLSAAVATLVFVNVAVPEDLFGAQTLTAVLLAVLSYSAVSAITIAVLFERLGATSFYEGLRDVLPIRRVTIPATIVAGLGMGWMARQGVAPGIVGVLFMLGMFSSYRVSLGARQQRARAARLRNVASALVSASGALDAFDDALGNVARVFSATTCELYLTDGEHRLVHVEDGQVGDATPSAAALLGLTLVKAKTLEPGTDEGGADGALVAPIVEDGETIGSLVLHERHGLEPWDDADEDVLDTIASEVHIALRNTELLTAIDRERRRLAEQTELLSGVLAAASDGIALISADGRILAWNPAMSELASHDGPEPVGKQWLDVLDVRDTSEGVAGDPASALAAAVAGSTLARTWRAGSDAGEQRWLRAVLSPASAGEEPAAVVLVRDVTASREVDRLKADFIATVSHELRTPLTPIKGFIELNLRRTLDPEQQQEMFLSMRRQVGRLEELVEDLLSMAQLDRDLVDMEQHTVQLRDVVSRVHMQHVETGRIMAHSEPVDVVGDLESIVRIVDALVDNAIKHTDGAIQVVVGRDQHQGTVTVVDNGPGIAPANQEVVFERFSRLGDHLLRTQGPGLGLPIARALARRLGGDVTVESKVGEGSRFTVALPLDDPASGPTAPRR